MPPAGGEMCPFETAAGIWNNELCFACCICLQCRRAKHSADRKVLPWDLIRELHAVLDRGEWCRIRQLDASILCPTFDDGCGRRAVTMIQRRRQWCK